MDDDWFALSPAPLPRGMLDNVGDAVRMLGEIADGALTQLGRDQDAALVREVAADGATADHRRLKALGVDLDEEAAHPHHSEREEALIWVASQALATLWQTVVMVQSGRGLTSIDSPARFMTVCLERAVTVGVADEATAIAASCTTAAEALDATSEGTIAGLAKAYAVLTAHRQL